MRKSVSMTRELVDHISFLSFVDFIACVVLNRRLSCPRRVTLL
jgi:hypothetical protein